MAQNPARQRAELLKIQQESRRIRVEKEKKTRERYEFSVRIERERERERCDEFRDSVWCAISNSSVE